MKHAHKLIFIFLLLVTIACDNTKPHNVTFEGLAVDEFIKKSAGLELEDTFIEFRADWCANSDAIYTNFLSKNDFKNYVNKNNLKLLSIDITLDKDNIMVEDFFKQHGIENKLPLYLLVQDGKYTFYDEKYFYKD